MLANSIEDTAVEDIEFRHLIEMPKDVYDDFFRGRGYSPSTVDEKRRRARLAVRDEARVAFANTPNRYQERADQELYALVKDLSRGGIAILYHEQVFPEDMFRVYFQSRTVTAIAVRCRKLGPKCFEVGARVLDASVKASIEA